jgi:hypothetical protein
MNTGGTLMQNNHTNNYSGKLVLRRRRAVRRRRYVLSMTVFTLTLLICIFAGTRFTFAKSDCSTGGSRIKCYRSITIYCGDTLTSIAREYCSDEWTDINSYIHEVEVINHLGRNELLIAGNYLTVPYYKDSPVE